MVADGDERSNAALVRAALLDRLTVPPNFHPVRTELGAEAAADEYDRELSGVAIDVALLGLGSDGHTASLFPRSPALDVRDRHVVATEARLAPWVERVTLTVEALGAAAHVVFLAVGEDKAAAARRAFDEPPSRDTPAEPRPGRPDDRHPRRSGRRSRTLRPWLTSPAGSRSTRTAHRFSRTTSRGLCSRR